MDHVFGTKVLTNWSFRPVHDQIMATEATRVAQLLQIVRALKIPPRCVKAVKTDAAVLHGFAAKHRKSLQALADRTFEDLPHLRDIFERLDAGQSQLDARCLMSQRNGDKDKAFRWAAGGDVKLLPCSYKEPTMHAAEPTPPSPWRVLESEEEAAKAAEGEGLFLEGAPGTGKTWWTRRLVERLRAQGKRVDIVAKTHAAVQNFGLGAVTLDHYMRRHIRAGALQCDYLVVDEVIQVITQLWADLMVARMWGAKLILCGYLAQYASPRGRAGLLGHAAGAGLLQPLPPLGERARTRRSLVSSPRCTRGSQRPGICTRRWPRRA